MTKEKCLDEAPEVVRKELSILYDIGVSVEELDYLLTLKMKRSA
jgi:hypothetical protein